MVFKLSCAQKKVFTMLAQMLRDCESLLSTLQRHAHGSVSLHVQELDSKNRLAQELAGVLHTFPGVCPKP